MVPNRLLIWSAPACTGPGYETRQRGYLEVSERQRKKLEGSYQLDEGKLVVRSVRGDLFALTKDQGRLRLMASSKFSFFTPREGEQVEFRGKEIEWRLPDGTIRRGSRVPAP